MAEWVPWVAFLGGVVVLLALDLGVFHRGEHVMSVRAALAWTAGWIGLAMAFAALVWSWKGAAAGQEFLAGYFIEKALSVDNIFVFVLVFAAFAIRAVDQHKVLFWGIIGAIIMRAAFIFAGVALLERFHWLIYVFGAFLVYGAYKMWKGDTEDIDLERNPVVRLFRRFMPLDCTYVGHGFTVVRDGVRMATPLLLALVAIETADLIFALDSVPAVLAISRDPFIVFTSNIFAILGLRSLYFALAGCLDRFHYLHYGLALVLGFVGLKMLLIDIIHVPTLVALGLVLGTVIASMLISLARPVHREIDPEPGACEDERLSA